MGLNVKKRTLIGILGAIILQGWWMAPVMASTTSGPYPYWYSYLGPKVSNQTIYSLAKTPTGTLVVDAQNGVYEESSSGWTELGNGPYSPESASTALAVNPTTGSIVVGSSGVMSQYTGVYTWQSGQWTPLGNNDPNVPMTSLVYGPGSKPTLYAGTTVGPFALENGTWVSLNAPSSSDYCGSIAINPNGDVVVGTVGGHVWQDANGNWTQLGTTAVAP